MANKFLYTEKPLNKSVCFIHTSLPGKAQGLNMVDCWLELTHHYLHHPFVCSSPNQARSPFSHRGKGRWSEV